MDCPNCPNRKHVSEFFLPKNAIMGNQAIIAFNREYLRVETFEQFRFQQVDKRHRRVGMLYYIRYEDEESGNHVLIQDKITIETDAKWLNTAIKMNLVYLEKVDWDLTKAAIKK